MAMNVILTPCVVTPKALTFVAAQEVTEEMAECALVGTKSQCFVPLCM